MKKIYGLGLFLLCSGCAVMAARQQLDDARAHYQTRLANVQQRVNQWQQDYQELANDCATFQRKLTTDQAEKLNRAATLQTDEAWTAFVASLSDHQRAVLVGLSERTKQVADEQRELGYELNALRSIEQYVANLEQRYEAKRQSTLLALSALQQQQYNQQLLQQRQFEQAQQSMNQTQLLNELQQMNRNLQGLRYGW